MARLAVDLPWIAKYVNTGIVIILLLFGYLGTIISSNFHIGTAIFYFYF